MHIVQPCLNLNKIDLVFITDISICLPSYSYFHFPPFRKILSVLQVVKLSPVKCMYTWQKISKISIEDKKAAAKNCSEKTEKYVQHKRYH